MARLVRAIGASADPCESGLADKDSTSGAAIVADASRPPHTRGMPFTTTLASALARSANMLEHHLADLSDADLLVRPVPAANHAAWQIAHLVDFIGLVVRSVSPGLSVPQSAAFSKAAARESAKSDDPELFVSKADLIAQLRAVTEALVATMSRLRDADLEQPTPPEFHGLAPTLGELILTVPLHASMHLGQLQVIRRKLGKPNLF